MIWKEGVKVKTKLILGLIVEEGVQAQLHSFLTPTVNRDELSAPAGLFLAKEPLVTIQKEAG